MTVEKVSDLKLDIKPNRMAERMSLRRDIIEYKKYYISWVNLNNLGSFKNILNEN